MSRKSIIDSEEWVFKIIAAIKEYKNSFAFSSTRRSKLKKIVRRSVVSLKHLNNIEARATGKEHLDYFMNEWFFEEKISSWGSVKKLNLRTFSSGDKPIKCKKREMITLKTDINLFS